MQYQWDTGSICSVVDEEGYRRLGFPKCHPMTTSLMAYGGKTAKGQCFVDVKIGEKVQTKLPQSIPMIVVKEKGLNLLGLDWSDSFGLTSRGTSALLDIPKDLNFGTQMLLKNPNFCLCNRNTMTYIKTS